jgi:hypothetical protein
MTIRFTHSVESDKFPMRVPKINFDFSWTTPYGGKRSDDQIRLTCIIEPAATVLVNSQTLSASGLPANLCGKPRPRDQAVLKAEHAQRGPARQSTPAMSVRPLIRGVGG